jgi:hypothetical protein
MSPNEVRDLSHLHRSDNTRAQILDACYLVWNGAFRFGALQWCWRSLTYWKRQPMRPVAQPLALQSWPAAA